MRAAHAVREALTPGRCQRVQRDPAGEERHLVQLGLSGCARGWWTRDPKRGPTPVACEWGGKGRIQPIKLNEALPPRLLFYLRAHRAAGPIVHVVLTPFRRSSVQAPTHATSA